jgi:hypothetical protein
MSEILTSLTYQLGFSRIGDLIAECAVKKISKLIAVTDTSSHSTPFVQETLMHFAFKHILDIFYW